jgi:hypothetical protein
LPVKVVQAKTAREADVREAKSREHRGERTKGKGKRQQEQTSVVSPGVVVDANGLGRARVGVA